MRDDVLPYMVNHRYYFVQGGERHGSKDPFKKNGPEEGAFL